MARAVTMVALAVVFFGACRERTPEERCDAIRQRGGHRCCPAWTRAAGDSCVSRNWEAVAFPDGSDRVSSAVDVATDASGRAVLTWLETTGANDSSVMAAVEDVHGAWSRTAVAERLGGKSFDAHAACAGDGACTVVWTQMDGHAAVFAADHVGSAWSLPSDAADALSFPPHVYDPRIAAGVDGETLIVWSQHHGGTMGLALARRAPGASFERPRDSADVLSPPVFFTNDGRVTRNERGDALVSWYQSTGAQLRVFVSERAGSHGAFTHPSPESYLSVDIPGPEGLGGRYVDETTPAIAASGAAIVVWEQPLDASSVALFAAHRDASGVWQRPRDPADSFSAAGADVCCPRTAFSSDGHLYVAWLDAGIVQLAHRLPDGSWSASGRQPVALSTPGSRVESLELAVGRDGGVVVVWNEGETGERRVVARRSSTHGAGSERQRWDPPVVLSPSSGADAYAPSVAVGGSHDRAVVAWIQSARVRVATVD
jgi:hypothetical protein